MFSVDYACTTVQCFIQYAFYFLLLSQIDLWYAVEDQLFQTWSCMAEIFFPLALLGLLFSIPYISLILTNLTQG